MSNLYMTSVSDSGKSKTTRGGHRFMHTRIDGWCGGVYIEAEVEGDRVIFSGYRNGGSNGKATEDPISGGLLFRFDVPKK